MGSERLWSLKHRESSLFHWDDLPGLMTYQNVYSVYNRLWLAIALHTEPPQMHHVLFRVCFTPLFSPQRLRWADIIVL